MMTGTSMARALQRKLGRPVGAQSRKNQLVYRDFSRDVTRVTGGHRYDETRPPKARIWATAGAPAPLVRIATWRYDSRPAAPRRTVTKLPGVQTVRVYLLKPDPGP
jgi:hypothetical protein